MPDSMLSISAADSPTPSSPSSPSDQRPTTPQPSTSTTAKKTTAEANPMDRGAKQRGKVAHTARPGKPEDNAVMQICTVASLELFSRNTRLTCKS